MGPTRAETAAARVERLLERSRHVMIVPTLLLLFGTVGVFVYAVVYAVDATRKIVEHPFPIAHNVGLIIVEIDVLLVGATMLVMAFGLYELFVARPAPGQRSEILPPWLAMSDLNDLKARVVSMLVLVATVTFVDVVVDFQQGAAVLYLGGAVALVVGALTVYLRFGTASARPGSPPTPRAAPPPDVLPAEGPDHGDTAAH